MPVMDIFNRQDEVARRSRQFHIGFFMAVALAVCLLYLPINFLFRIVLEMLGEPAMYLFYGDPVGGIQDWKIYGFFSIQSFILIGGGVALTILMVAKQRREELLDGGGVFMAQLLGGVELIEPKTPAETQLMNVIEEMSVASGLPRPLVFILPKEMGINAVTAGEDEYDAVIAVTQGALNTFNRRELQAVMAHEFAHILNGDSALNLHLAGWLYGLYFFSARGYDLVTLTAENTFGKAVPLMIAGLGIWVAGWAGKFAGQILEAAISRQREYLADAFAAQFTRDPQSLADALKKIGGTRRRGAIGSGQALSFKSFFIASPLWHEGLLSTHPPLEKRIGILDPGWDGTFPEVSLASAAGTAGTKNLVKELRFPATPRGRQILRENLSGLDLWSSFLLAGILAGGDDRAKGQAWEGPDLQAAQALLAAIPEPLKEALNRTEQMPALIAAVFLQEESVELYQKQLRLVEHFFNRETGLQAHDFKLLLQAGPQFHDGHESSIRLPLLDLAAPTLRALSQDQKQQLMDLVKALIASDSKIDLFEIAAGKILEKCLGRLFPVPVHDAPFMTAKERLDQLGDDVRLIMSALAHLGCGDEETARGAFQVAMGSFSQWGAGSLAPAGELSSKKLLEALGRLSEASLSMKNNLLTGAAACALYDQKVNKKEYELLRALAAALDLSLPYFSPADQAPAQPGRPGAPDAYAEAW